MFSLSAECIARGTATPSAEREDRRNAWLYGVLLVPIMGLVVVVGGVWATAVCAPFALALAGWFIRRQGNVHRRRRRLWREPFSGSDFLLREIPHFALLDAPGRELFIARAKVFLAETVFHGAGVEVDGELKLRAAASAIIPTLGFPEWDWRGLREIIFRPEGYEDGSYCADDGVVTEFEESGMVGSSGVLSGVMMLSSDDLIWECAHIEEGVHVGFHEFAHFMAANGMELAERDRAGWTRLLKREERRFEDGESLLDDYALFDGDELFASASELFFTIPHRMKEWHRELYWVLSRAYRQDPCMWIGDYAPQLGKPQKRSRRRRGRRKTR